MPVNNSPNAKGILTGKIFEYMGARRPIIAIGPVDGDLAQILNTTGSGRISAFDDEKGFIDHLRIYLRKFNEGELRVETSKIDRYSRKNLTKKLSNILNEMSA